MDSTPAEEALAKFDRYIEKVNLFQKAVGALLTKMEVLKGVEYKCSIALLPPKEHQDAVGNIYFSCAKKDQVTLCRYIWEHLEVPMIPAGHNFKGEIMDGSIIIWVMVQG